MRDSLLIIFARNPVWGKVKTRLAATLGPDKALEIYKRLLQKTREVVLPLETDKTVCFSDTVENQDGWFDGQFRKQVQSGGDLGERMALAFEEAFSKGYRKVGIIGSDCYELQTGHLRQAFAFLDTHDLVIGPATDGGYYFLGSKRFLPEIFENKTWSSAAVLQETLATATHLQLQVALLPMLADVDEEKDLTGLPALQIP